MDKYTKVVLTIIAICLISLNIYVWKPEKVIAHIDGAPSTAAEIRGAIHLVVQRDCVAASQHVPQTSNISCNYNPYWR